MGRPKDFSMVAIAKLLPNGVRSTHFTVGDGPNATNVFYGKWPPNTHVAAHTHGSDYCEIVLEGRQRVGKKWYDPGDVRIASGGTNYGPLETGDEGCTLLIIFNGGDWVPRPARAGTEAGLFIEDIENLVPTAN